LNLFKKKQYVPITGSREGAPVVPDGLWLKCPSCRKAIYQKELGEFKVCPNCSGYFRLSARERLALVADEGTFEETDSGMASKNPADYPGYEEKLRKTSEAAGSNEAVICGFCEVCGNKTALAVMDSHFIMGSMGSVVGEKLTRLFEKAVEKRSPVIVFSASGGARMQEGIISLMQMAKVSAAVKKHSDAGLFYISALTDPTTGGVSASFAALGDVILAEPGALIGFAGRRVIEQTMKQKLPDGFQTAEFIMDHGFIDKIAERAEMKDTIGALLALHRGSCDGAA
jgi:acetyl-CoA carboxylase carboxyl transferase subunit beta